MIYNDTHFQHTTIHSIRHFVSCILSLHEKMSNKNVYWTFSNEYKNKINNITKQWI